MEIIYILEIIKMISYKEIQKNNTLSQYINEVDKDGDKTNINNGVSRDKP